MSKNRPYYNLNQIITGKYTTGGEYYTEEGIVYKGPYHILPNNQKFSGFVPFNESVELYDITGQFATNTTYRTLSNIKTNNYVSPVFYLPKPEDEDYNKGYFTRYFIQRRSDPLNSIVEVDLDQYSSINLINGPGLSGYLWRKTSFEWRIRGEANLIVQINQATVNMQNILLPGLKTYLKNMLEFAK